ncbi:MAG: hypothetical protein Q7W38_09840 [Deltaproteobacteria bacterium]|nr:hypothetical protein [Deltaproteobacteria bacterium]
MLFDWMPSAAINGFNLFYEESIIEESIIREGKNYAARRII